MSAAKSVRIVSSLCALSSRFVSSVSAAFTGPTCHRLWSLKGLRAGDWTNGTTAADSRQQPSTAADCQQPPTVNSRRLSTAADCCQQSRQLLKVHDILRWHKVDSSDTSSWQSCLRDAHAISREMNVTLDSSSGKLGWAFGTFHCIRVRRHGKSALAQN